MDGILLVDKPKGWTSHDVVAKIRRILATEIRNQKSENSLIPDSGLLIAPSAKLKVGHTGTLDPMATGLLVLVVGSYTKRASEFSKLDKVYEAEITLGATSTTGDAEGEISTRLPNSYEKMRSHKIVKPGLAEVEAVLKLFVGEIEQVPPQFSAIKVGGRKAYEAARKGQKLELKPRQVTVYWLQVTDYKYPTLKITTKVSSGTYIRSLAEDIGVKLGTGAYLSALRRTQIGNFRLSDAITINRLEQGLSD